MHCPRAEPGKIPAQEVMGPPQKTPTRAPFPPALNVSLEDTLQLTYLGCGRWE